MIILENISTGEVFNGNEIEYFIDDDTHIGEVYLDGDLVFQSLEVINDELKKLVTDYRKASVTESKRTV
jgi:hypothetical protein